MNDWKYYNNWRHYNGHIMNKLYLLCRFRIMLFVSWLIGVSITIAVYVNAGTLGCPTWPGQDEGVQKIGAVTVSIKRQVSEQTDNSNNVCVARVLDGEGHLLFMHYGQMLQMNSISGNDINGDGWPEIVIMESLDSTFSYFIVSVVDGVPVIRQIKNGYGIRFEHLQDGRIVLVVPDDGFKNLPDMIDIYRYDLIVPEIRFVLEGNKLKNVSSELRGSYNNAIQRARAKLTPSDIVSFREDIIKDKFKYGVIKGRILTIVLSYLYSGRDIEAFQALTKMWPPADKQRIQQIILDTRTNGSLRLERSNN